MWTIEVFLRKQLMKEKHIKRRDLAKALDMTPVQVTNMFHHNGFRITTLVRCLEVFGWKLTLTRGIKRMYIELSEDGTPIVVSPAESKKPS